jgi:hypothetical protein
MIIGLCGRAGTGKTSVAKYLVEKWANEIVSFAGPLKRMAMDIWGFTEEQVFGDASIKERVDPRLGFSPRFALQRLGTDICRKHLGDDVWTDTLFRRIKEKGDHKRIYVIDDVRFVNEAKRIYNEGGSLFRLHNDSSISNDVGAHQSEIEVNLIPDSYVTAEIWGSTELGLTHLFGLVDEAMEKIL